MRFEPSRLAGAVLVTPEPVADHRGFFARTFCAREFAAHGLETDFVQHSASYTRRRGSLRGMHFQRAPHEEAKLVACVRGAVLDVIVDLRPDSPTFAEWQGFELTQDNRAQLYIPKGFAHGFQALTDDVELFYRISAFYAADASTGVRHDDPAFGITWPLPIADMTDKDRAWPDFIQPRAAAKAPA